MGGENQGVVQSYSISDQVIQYRTNAAQYCTNDIKYWTNVIPHWTIVAGCIDQNLITV